jgi:Transglutaminase-like superfamily
MSCYDPSALFAAAHIRYEVVDDRAILLETESGTYLVLDGLATEIWLYLLRDRSRSLLQIQSQFELNRSELLSEIDRFRDECFERKFLTRSKPSSNPLKQRMAFAGKMLGFRAWTALLRSQWILERRGFHRAFEMIRTSSKPAAECSSSIDLSTARGIFLRAESLFWLKRQPEDCLPRSIALYTFLLQVGLTAEFIIGVCRYPFQAHAWVEVDGVPVVDEQNTVDNYAPIVRI